MAYRKTEFVERKRLETRARIVEAATSLVRVAGWRGCVLKTVAQRAGISTGSLYTHFTKISDLYTEAYNVIATGEYAVIAEIAKGDEPPLERLTTAIDTFTRRAIRGRVQAYAMIGEPVAPEVEANRQRHRRLLAGLLETIIRDGMDDGAFATQDPVCSSACILGALNETMIMRLEPEAITAPNQGSKLREEVRHFCLRAVQSPASTTRQSNNKVPA
ncbi:MAG: TetR/AcrR family transcriptional regulator [Pseudomonadota bacterium]